MYLVVLLFGPPIARISAGTPVTNKIINQKWLLNFYLFLIAHDLHIPHAFFLIRYFIAPALFNQF